MKVQDLLKLYQPPFTHHMGYIRDSTPEKAGGTHMVADFRGESDQIRPRGWGRFQYMKDGGTIHDEMEALIVRITESVKQDPELCVAALNQFWKENAE